MANTDRIFATFFVATSGNDEWSGNLPEPNADSTDGPFATLARARDAVRELKKTHHGLIEPVTIVVRGGKYVLDESLVLTEQDSGTRACPVTYTAYPGETPVLSGGRRLTGWQPYKGQIVQAGLPGAKGGRWRARQLFFDGRRQPRARWPKCDPEHPGAADWALMEGPAEEGSQTAFRYRPGTFRQSWAKPTQGEVSYYFYAQWAISTVPIRAINPHNRVITLVHGGYQFDVFPWYVADWSPGLQTFQPGNRFCVENLLEELDRPGEWCFDSEEGTFYFWPPSADIDDAEVVVPVLDCLVDLRGASWITLSGLTFTETTDGDNLHHDGTEGCGAMYARPGWRYVGDALHLKNAEHCGIEDNCFDSVGGNAIYLEADNARHVIRHNEIRGAGASGVCLAGSKLRHPALNEVSDNYIHHGGVLNKYSAGVFLGTSDGNFISHNRIEHLPHHGVQLGDNPSGRNVVEFNEIRHVCREVHDNGAINSWMERPPKDGERCGHIIRYNLIADCYSYALEDGQLKKHWTFGIYLDNYTSNCLVYGNIVIRATWAGVLVHGGKNNVIENNVLVDCGANLRFQNPIADWRYWKEHGFQHFMTGNHFCRNICYQTDPSANVLSLNRWTDRVVARCDENVVFQADGGAYAVDHRDDVPDDRKITCFDQWRRLGYDARSVVADPLFVNPKEDDYRLQPDSPALNLGFQPIDVSNIGIRSKP